jgi:hypothetical protein
MEGRKKVVAIGRRKKGAIVDIINELTLGKCRCSETGNSSPNCLGQLFGLRRMQNSMVNTERQRFILVRSTGITSASLHPV